MVVTRAVVEYTAVMGDVYLLQEQLELGMPLRYAAVLAGYEKDEIKKLKDDPEIQSVIALAKANMIREHLVKLRTKSKWNSQDSKWLLEKIFPEDFAGKILDEDGNERLIVEIRRVEGQKDPL